MRGAPFVGTPESTVSQRIAAVCASSSARAPSEAVPKQRERLAVRQRQEPRPDLVVVGWIVALAAATSSLPIACVRSDARAPRRTSTTS